jgi:hypothetical protein
MVYNLSVNILAAIIIFMSGYIWKNWISIRLADFVYRGIKIDGVWKATQSENTARGYKLAYPSTYTFELKQKADKICGTAKAEFGADHKEMVCYNVTGYIQDRFVILSLVLKERKRIAHSNFLLEVIGNGECMNGFMNFYALRSHEINAIQIICNKLNSGNG